MARRVRVYFLIFLAIYLLIFAIGVASEVSLKASVIRALLSATLFTALCLISVEAVIRCGVQERHDSGEKEQPATGKNLDITVSETMNETAHLHAPPKDKQDKSSAETQSEFVPLSARQIDPELSRIIKGDPGKVADIIRKMGFEQN